MYPERLINSYVWDQFRQHKSGIYSKYGQITPIFPVDDIQAGDGAWSGKPHIIYDSMVRPRQTRKSFYPVKSGQLLYSVRGSIDEIFEWREFIIDVLDREDQAAREINEFGGTLENNIFLHTICAYQLTYINTSYKNTPTQRKEQSADIVIPYEYHKVSQFS